MIPFVSVLDRLETVVEAWPDAVAVLLDGTPALTYASLQKEVARTAEALLGLGVGPERVVGLALPRSPGWVVAALGTWWAGGAFLPLDPCLPLERLEHMAAAAGLKAVVAEPDLADVWKRKGFPVLSPGSASGGKGASRHRPPADALAYVIFTSGSSGRPKGVLVPHRGIVPVLDAQVPAFGLRPGCRALWLLSPGFDASLSDVGTALVSGVTLCIESELGQAVALRMLDVVGRRGITHVDIPPALLRVLDPCDLPSCVETLVIGGEPCPPEVVRRWARRVRVVNVYGPTESTICTSLGPCDATTWDRPLLGRPIPGIRYFVLDDTLEPVAQGAPGELCVAGQGLARGYLGQQELTAAKFLTIRGERLYRTGDRVVATPDGEFTFLGRLDRQVKVRGQLVEPEEVEARLLEHPGVADAAVLTRSVEVPGLGGTEQERLVAFLVARTPDRPPSSGELGRHLGQVLPRWMLPSRFECLESLPRLVSGKVDFGALRARALGGLSRPVQTLATDLPRDILASIWRKVLGTDELSESQGFFEQGGDSLGLLEVVVVAQSRGLIVPPALIAEGRSIGEIVRWLENRSETIVATPGALDAGFLRRDVESDPTWRSLLDSARRRDAGTQLPQAPRAALITGATGHLGSRLLAELLTRTDATLHVLVRAPDPDIGLARVRDSLRLHNFLLDSRQRARLQVHCGDLEKPRLGLSTATWNELCGRLDTIYHTAARVNLVLPYAVLREANVEATRRVVRLQATGRVKRLHLASTLSVFVAADRNRGRLAEDDGLVSTRLVFGGYAQTKWASEWLVRDSRGAAGPSSIYRLGLITGDSRTGRSAAHDFLALFVRGLTRLGCVPWLEGDDLWLDVTPVDFAAAALACLSLRPASSNPATYHLASPRGLSFRELTAMLRARGLRLDEVAPAAWRKRIAAVERQDPEAAAACLALCRALPGGPGVFQAFRALDLFQATGVTFDCTAAREGLRGSGLPWPEPGSDLFSRYLDQWTESALTTIRDFDGPSGGATP